MAQDTSTGSSRTLLNWLGPNVLLLLSAISLAIALALASPPLQAIAGAAAPNGLPREMSTLTDMRRQSGLGVHASAVFTQYLYFPMIYSGTVAYTSATCGAATGESYASSWVYPPPTNPPAEDHPDLNLAIRGYAPTNASLSLVDYGGKRDPAAPQLYTLFTNKRAASFVGAYQVYDWNWACNCRGDPITNWQVTLAGLATTPGEVVRAPASGYDIGSIPTGYEALVLYASSTRLTITYTRYDSAAYGYMIHLEDICTDPNLLALYQQANNAGRSYLPALFAGQGVGRATTSQLKVAIRDTGSFMDPRSHYDWWQNQ